MVSGKIHSLSTMCHTRLSFRVRLLGMFVQCPFIETWSSITANTTAHVPPEFNYGAQGIFVRWAPFRVSGSGFVYTPSLRFHLHFCKRIDENHKHILFFASIRLYLFIYCCSNRAIRLKCAYKTIVVFSDFLLSFWNPNGFNAMLRLNCLIQFTQTIKVEHMQETLNNLRMIFHSAIHRLNEWDLSAGCLTRNKKIIPSYSISYSSKLKSASALRPMHVELLIFEQL